MIKFLKAKAVAMYALFFTVGIALTAAAANADVPTATSTLDTLGGVIINTVVSFATTVFTTYWPYALLAIVLSAVIGIGYRIVHLGGGKGR